MTITQALKLASDRLKTGRINNPPLEAEILLSGILKKPPEFLLAHGEKKLSKSPIAKYQRLLKRRLKGEPIAYLTGRKEFYGLNFMVNKNVLIPRPETELMVDEAIKLITRLSSEALAKGGNSQLVTHDAQRTCPPKLRRRGTTLIDVGTGSGCIIISLAKQIKNHKLKITNYKLIGIDISKKALDVATKNAKYHNVDKQIKFLKSDLLKPIIDDPKFVIRLSSEALAKGGNSKFVILANLPYGWPVWKNNRSLDTIGLKFEPEIALFTNKNGLGLYEQLFKQIKELWAASCGLRDVNALCEFDPRQTKKIRQLIKRELPAATLEIKKDLSGLNRLAIITLNS